MSWIKNLSSSRNLRLLLALGLFILVSTTACGETAESTLVATSSSTQTPTCSLPAAARPVIHMSQEGGWGLNQGFTYFMLWDNGRVVFTNDRVCREAYLAPSQVASLVDAARFLYDLDDYYGCAVTDVSSVYLTVEAEQGHRKTVRFQEISTNLTITIRTNEETYSIDCSPPKEIQAFLEMVKDSLPADAPLWQPTEVFVDSYPAYGIDAGNMMLSEWPPELEGFLQGEAMHQAIQLAGLDSEKLFLMKGEAYYVWVDSVSPSLHDHAYKWERPRHPNATSIGYHRNYGHLFRFSGVSQEEIASWYKAEMPDYRWILVKEEGADFQVWVPDYDRDILEFRFYPDHFYIKQIFVEQNVPRYLDAIQLGCTGSDCQLCKGITLQQARTWFHDHMVYLGWSETSLGVYSRSDGDVTEIIRFGFRTESGGIAVYVEERQRIVPAWWPSPVDTPLPTPT